MTPVRHYMRTDLIGRELMPTYFIACTYCGRDGPALHRAVFDSVLHNGRAVAGINAKSVACQRTLLPPWVRRPSVLALPNMFSAGALYGFGGFLLGQLLFADRARFRHHVCHDVAPPVPLLCH